MNDGVFFSTGLGKALAQICIFWATYSFSDYLQGGGMTAVRAGTITTIKLWMRPIGGNGGGWLGDKFSNISVLIVALFLATLAMVGVIGTLAALTLRARINL